MASSNGRRQSVANLVSDLTVIVNAEFNRKYVPFEPEFASMVYKRKMGFTDKVTLPFAGFIGPMQKFTGSRKHRSFPDVNVFDVVNEEFDNAVDVDRAALERASMLAGDQGIQSLDIYRQRIADMNSQARENYLTQVFRQIESGTNTNLGQTFDGQAMYSTTHSTEVETAGTQENLISGSGVTASDINTDINAIFSAFGSFKWTDPNQSPDEARTQLNRMEAADLSKILFVIPTELIGVFRELASSRLFGGGNTGVNSGLRFISKPFADPIDWYAMLLDENIHKPWYNQIELATEIDTPTLQDESARENKVFTYGVYQREAICPFAWWKSIKVNNT